MVRGWPPTRRQRGYNENRRRPGQMGLTSTERDTIRERLRDEGAEYVAVFGSYVRDEETAGSDVDVLVRFAEPKTLLGLARIERELGERLGKPVELVTEAALSPYLVARVDAEKEVLLA